MRLPIAIHNSKEYGIIIGEYVEWGRTYLFGTSKEYESILPKVKEKYEELLKNAKRNLKEALDKFLKETSSSAILRYDFIRSLSENLEISETRIIKVLLSTNYIAEQLSYIKENFKKKKKENPLEYAECVGELVSLLGFDLAYSLLKANGINIGKSTLRSLYKVSMMPSNVKKLIEEGKLPLTLVFEIPEEKLDIAEKLAGLSFSEAKEVLKYIK